MEEKLYQIGLPIEALSTVFSNWACLDKRVQMLVSAAKTENWAVVQVRSKLLATAIEEDVKEAKINVVDGTKMIIL